MLCNNLQNFTNEKTTLETYQLKKGAALPFLMTPLFFILYALCFHLLSLLYTLLSILAVHSLISDNPYTHHQ